jgi:uncharacterized phage protein (TIGR02216 family)
MKQARAFPWEAVMAFGLGTLRLAPDAFWRMTPRELAAAVRGIKGIAAPSAAMSQAALAELIARFPDQYTEYAGGKDPVR